MSLLLCRCVMGSPWRTTGVASPVKVRGWVSARRRGVVLSAKRQSLNDGVSDERASMLWSGASDWQTWLTQLPLKRIAAWVFVGFLAHQLKDFFGVPPEAARLGDG